MRDEQLRDLGQCELAVFVDGWRTLSGRLRRQCERMRK